MFNKVYITNAMDYVSMTSRPNLVFYKDQDFFPSMVRHGLPTVTSFEFSPGNLCQCLSKFKCIFIRIARCFVRNVQSQKCAGGYSWVDLILLRKKLDS